MDRLLGKRALFKMAEVHAMGGPSPPTLYRAAREGLIELVNNGSSSDLTARTEADTSRGSRAYPVLVRQGWR